MVVYNWDVACPQNLEKKDNMRFRTNFRLNICSRKLVQMYEKCPTEHKNRIVLENRSHKKITVENNPDMEPKHKYRGLHVRS